MKRINKLWSFRRLFKKCFQFFKKTIETTNKAVDFRISSPALPCFSELIHHRSNRQKVFCKKLLFKFCKNSQGYTCVRVFYLLKLQASTWINKGILAQRFSCDFCGIFKNTSGGCFWHLEYVSVTDPLWWHFTHEFHRPRFVY